jgi:hypothetical protein
MRYVGREVQIDLGGIGDKREGRSFMTVIKRNIFSVTCICNMLC